MERIDEASLSCSIEEGCHVVDLLPELHVVITQLVQLVDECCHLLRVRGVVFRVFSLGCGPLMILSPLSLCHHFLRLGHLWLSLAMLSKCKAQLLLQLFDLMVCLLKVHLAFL